MKTIIDFFKNSTIQIAITGGLSIIVQSYFYKKVLHLDINGLLFAMPGLIFAMYGSLSMAEIKAKKGKKVDPIVLKLLNPLYWHLLIILTTALSILIPYWRQ